MIIRPSVIKYYRILDKALVLMPSKEGVLVLEGVKAYMSYEPNVTFPLIKGEEEVAGAKVISYTLKTKHNITFCNMEYNLSMSYQKFRVHDSGFIQYFITLPIFV